jgi:hypothetical protein
VRTLVVVAMIGRVASAQVAADGAKPRRDTCCTELGVSVGGGVETEATRPTGWLARLDYFLAIAPPPFHAGPEVAVHLGLDYWHAGPDWGIALPVSGSFGGRVGVLRGALGIGFDVLLVDRVANSTGVGLYAPFGVATIGVVAGGWTFAVDARAAYRWQFGSTSRGQLDLALLVGRTLRAR